MSTSKLQQSAYAACAIIAVILLGTFLLFDGPAIDRSATMAPELLLGR